MPNIPSENDAKENSSEKMWSRIGLASKLGQSPMEPVVNWKDHTINFRFSSYSNSIRFLELPFCTSYFEELIKEEGLDYKIKNSANKSAYLQNLTKKIETYFDDSYEGVIEYNSAYNKALLSGYIWARDYPFANVLSTYEVIITEILPDLKSKHLGLEFQNLLPISHVFVSGFDSLDEMYLHEIFGLIFKGMGYQLYQNHLIKLQKITEQDLLKPIPSTIIKFKPPYSNSDEYHKKQQKIYEHLSFLAGPNPNKNNRKIMSDTQFQELLKMATDFFLNSEIPENCISGKLGVTQHELIHTFVSLFDKLNGVKVKRPFILYKFISKAFEMTQENDLTEQNFISRSIYKKSGMPNGYAQLNKNK